MIFFKKKKNKDEERSSNDESVQTTSELPIANEKTEKQTWFGKLKTGLSKSSSKINEGLKDVLIRQKLDDEMLEELENLLITTDLGVKTATEITTHLAKKKFDRDITSDEIKQDLAEYIQEKLTPLTVPFSLNKPSSGPHVLLVAGVNGSGKTTTIGKIASDYTKAGKKIMLAACDTYRAAAVEQLELWAKRAECEFMRGEDNADPASVAYKAFEAAMEKEIDLLIIDTAGRLQNKKNLMEQLAKIVRVLKKQDELIPHDSIIVLDSTTGQNAISQVKTFNETIELTGMIITKLDGTAKGGVVVALANEFSLPIHAIGVGEGQDDLQAFDAQAFANNLVGLDN